jgi:hypothetical protein
LYFFHPSPSARWLCSFFIGFRFDSCHCASFAVFYEKTSSSAWKSVENASIPFEERACCCLHPSILNPLHNILGTHQF